MITIREDQKVLSTDCLVPGCGQKDVKSMSTHLRKHKMSIQQYLELHLNAEISNPAYNPLFKEKLRKANKGKHPWNYNLTANTDERVLKSCEKSAKTQRQMYARGELKIWNDGLTKETSEGVRKQAEKMIGELNPMFGIGEDHPLFGTKRLDSSKMMIENNPAKREDVKEILREYALEQFKDGMPQETKDKISIKNKGENHWNWIEDRTTLLYPDEFNNELKTRIRKKFHFICQLCGKNGFIIHHIDYNKQNNSEENFTCLCKSCHSKTTNGNRLYYEYLFYWMNEFDTNYIDFETFKNFKVC